MCGSDTELTNQASVIPMTTVGGNQRMALLYHDGPAGNPRRKVHAECLWYGAGRFALATRSTTEFANCMHDVNANAIALRSHFNGRFVAAPNTGAQLEGNRYTIGPWERFDVLDGRNNVVPPSYARDHAVRFRAHSNGKFVCADSDNGANPPQLKANRATAGRWELFQAAPNGEAGGITFMSFNNSALVEVGRNGSTSLFSSGPNGSTAPGVSFDIFHR